ncbi:MAG: RNA polymerase sigma factor [Nannocystales bacterium]
MNRSLSPTPKAASGKPPPSADDAAVFELEGAELAAVLYDRHGADVNRVVRSLLGPDPEHDDIVQRVFSVALEKLDGLRERAALRPWLVAIAANTTRDELRRRRRWRWLNLTGSDDTTEVPAPGEDLEGRALLKRFYATVHDLPPDDRIVFLFRYVDERPLAEIASVCGCSVATVKRRLRRANERFLRRAQRDPELLDRIQRGTRWEAGT